MEELNEARVSMGIHAAVAIAVGWVSFEVAAMSRSLFSILLGLVILYVTGFIAQRMTGQKGIKWWAANGLVIYLFIWLISWTFFHSLALA